LALVETDNPDQILWELPKEERDRSLNKNVFDKNLTDGCTLDINDMGLVRLIRYNIVIWVPKYLNYY